MDKDSYFADIKEMFTATERSIKELRESNKETDLRMVAMREETDRIVKENAIAQKETDRMIKELSRRIGGIDDNIGHHAEQFFQSVLEKSWNSAG